MKLIKNIIITFFSLYSMNPGMALAINDSTSHSDGIVTYVHGTVTIEKESTRNTAPSYKTSQNGRPGVLRCLSGWIDKRTLSRAESRF